MKIDPKKQSKIYIKNVYANNQKFKPQKQNKLNNIFSENYKLLTDYNINKNTIFNHKKILFKKKALKTMYQNNFSNKSNLLNDNNNFLTQSNIHNKSDKKHDGRRVSFGILSDNKIFCRKYNKKNDKIISPFSERSISENKINPFTREYFFCNNKDYNNISYIEISSNKKSKKTKTKTNVGKISSKLSDINYQNIPTKLYNYSLSKENNSYNNKIYFCKENIQKNRLVQRKKTSYAHLYKISFGFQITPLLHKNFSNINITCLKRNNTKIRIKTDENERIRKYNLNNFSDKRKIRVRHYFTHYLTSSSESSGINNENILNNDNYLNNNSPKINDENKFLEKIDNKKYLWIKNIKKSNSLYNNKEYNLRNTIYKKPSFKSNNNINQNIVNLRNDLTSNLIFNEEKLFEKSAIIIQSVFRSYLFRVKLVQYLYIFKKLELIIKILNSSLDKNLNLKEKKLKLFNYLKLLKKRNFISKKNNINIKSYTNLIHKTRKKVIFNIIINDNSNERYENKYEILEPIGEGNYGIVYKAKNKKTFELRAIKFVNKEKIKNNLRVELMSNDIEEEFEKRQKKLLNEINCMKICSQNNTNDNSVKFYEYFDTKDNLIIVMELCNTCLQSLLIERRSGFSSREILDILNQLNNTFKIMKANNIVHRDLKLANILIKYKDSENKKFIVKLTDYGISRQLNYGSQFSSNKGTLNTMAPEVLNGEKYNDKCDLWSLGVIIYQLLFKEYPYKGEKLALLGAIDKYGQKLLKQSGNSKLDNLIRKLLVQDPNKRYSWEQYFNDEFFSVR